MGLSRVRERQLTYYPIEDNLNIDPHSGGYLIGSISWKPMEKISKEELLRRFPPDMVAVLHHYK
jgi:hypothetical protein